MIGGRADQQVGAPAARLCSRESARSHSAHSAALRGPSQLPGTSMCRIPPGDPIGQGDPICLGGAAAGGGAGLAEAATKRCDVGGGAYCSSSWPGGAMPTPATGLKMF